MEVDEDYYEFCFKFKIRRREVLESDWFKERHGDDETQAEMYLDIWEDSDYDILRSLAVCSDAPDWKQYLSDLEEQNRNYHKMRNRMREEMKNG